MNSKNLKSIKESSMNYSAQAGLYAQAVEDIDFKDLERWYLESRVIGGSDIMAYLIHKKKIQ